MEGKSRKNKREIFTVPIRTYLPEALLTGLAVWAVLGVRIACSIVPGLADWVPGRMKPVTGLPDWDIGLIKINNETENYYSILWIGLLIHNHHHH